MKPLTILGREPVEILSIVQAALLVGVALSVPHLTEAAVPLIVACLGAVFGSVQAVMVRPVTPAAFTAVVTTVAPLLAYYGLDLDATLVASINALIVALLAHPTRQQVSPVVRNDLAA
ncbi:hypothetical protein ABZ234_03830 [Nocardiopsis sp. NPDC006198]|uniref:hypothetical protein n=1 Tax=Nocardiopsis sp. NPDC006198 TaxID=3154472 RepID=UPI0033BA95CD